MARRSFNSPSPFVEKDVRRWVRDTWKQGIFFSEYALGGDRGVPDCQLIQPRRIVPCELKVGDVINNNYMIDLRPGQRDYHYECYEYAVPTIFIIGYKRTYVAVAGAHVVSCEIEGVIPSSLCLDITHHDDINEAIDVAVRIANKPRLV